MSDHTRSHIGITNARQFRPLFPGDAIHAYFRVNSIEPAPGTAKGIVMETSHVLLDSNDRVSFSVDKLTHFPQFASRTDRAKKVSTTITTNTKK